jgi:hypothetical protein
MHPRVRKLPPSKNRSCIRSPLIEYFPASLQFPHSEEGLRSPHSLGYTPDANAQSGYRTIKVGIRKKEMIVHGREGYYPSIKK